MDLVAEANKLLSSWDRRSMILVFGGYALIAIAIICSLAITAFVDHLKPLHTKMLSFIAAVCSGLLAALHPVDSGTAFRQAWRIVNQAKLDYVAIQDEDHRKGIAAAIQRAESILQAAEGRAPVRSIGAAPVEPEQK